MQIGKILWVNFFTRFFKSSFIKDSFWALSGSIVVRGLSIVSGIILARMLQSDTYGAFTTIRGFLLTITVFSTLGLGYTATKYFARYNGSNKLYSLYVFFIKLTAIFSSLISLFLFFFSEWYALNLLENIELSSSVKILAIAIVFNAITTTQIGVIAGMKKFKELSYINAILGILGFFITILLTYFFDYNGSVYSLLIIAILNVFSNNYFIKKTICKTTFNGKIAKNIKCFVFKDSIPLALQEAGYSFTSWLSPILIIKYSNFTDLAIFNIALQWNAVILFIPSILRNVVLTHLSLNSNDNIKQNSILLKTLSVSLIATFIPAFLVFIFVDSIVKLYGVQYNSLSGLMVLSVFLTIPISLSNIYSQAFMSKGKNWLMLALKYIRDIIIIVSFLFFVHYYVYIEVSYILMISYIVGNFLFLILIIFIYTKYLSKKNG